MGLFKRKIKTPEELAEIAETERLEDEQREYRVRKFNIDGNNPDVDYYDISLSMRELTHIYNNLQRSGTYRGIHGESPKDQRNPSNYPNGTVQPLMDYAKGCRLAMDWLMENAIDGGIAHYDNKGIFKFDKEVDDESY